MSEGRPNLSSPYLGWPHKLTPLQYGRMLATPELSLSDREGLLKKVPEGWRYVVIDSAAHFLATEIADRITNRDERRALLDALPDDIRKLAEPLAASLYYVRTRKA